MKTAVTAVMITLMAVSIASGNLRVYAIDPVRADWSGRADPEDGVSEILTVSFDEPITASLFCGTRGGNGQYNVGIYSYPGGVTRLAEKLNVDPPLDHNWLTCSLDVVHPDSFIKGRQVEVRWTRGGSDSIQYYYQDGDPYKCGFMVTDQPHAGQDLACQVMGRPMAAAA